MLIGVAASLAIGSAELSFTLFARRLFASLSTVFIFCLSAGVWFVVADWMFRSIGIQKTDYSDQFGMLRHVVNCLAIGSLGWAMSAVANCSESDLHS